MFSITYSIAIESNSNSGIFLNLRLIKGMNIGSKPIYFITQSIVYTATRVATLETPMSNKPLDLAKILAIL